MRRSARHRSPDRYRSVPRAVSTGVSSAPNARTCHASALAAAVLPRKVLRRAEGDARLLEEAKVMLCGYPAPVTAHCRPQGSVWPSPRYPG